jgi:hypothetical protein
VGEASQGSSRSCVCGRKGTDREHTHTHSDFPSAAAAVSAVPVLLFLLLHLRYNPQARGAFYPHIAKDKSQPLNPCLHRFPCTYRFGGPCACRGPRPDSAAGRVEWRDINIHTKPQGVGWISTAGRAAGAPWRHSYSDGQPWHRKTRRQVRACVRGVGGWVGAAVSVGADWGGEAPLLLLSPMASHPAIPNPNPHRVGGVVDQLLLPGAAEPVLLRGGARLHRRRMCVRACVRALLCLVPPPVCMHVRWALRRRRLPALTITHTHFALGTTVNLYGLRPYVKHFKESLDIILDKGECVRAQVGSMETRPLLLHTPHPHTHSSHIHTRVLHAGVDRRGGGGGGGGGRGVPGERRDAVRPHPRALHPDAARDGDHGACCVAGVTRRVLGWVGLIVDSGVYTCTSVS